MKRRSAVPLPHGVYGRVMFLNYCFQEFLARFTLPLWVFGWLHPGIDLNDSSGRFDRAVIKSC